jgi:hypothetical protein
LGNKIIKNIFSLTPVIAWTKVNSCPFPINSLFSSLSLSVISVPAAFTFTFCGEPGKEEEESLHVRGAPKLAVARTVRAIFRSMSFTSETTA